MVPWQPCQRPLDGLLLHSEAAWKAKAGEAGVAVVREQCQREQVLSFLGRRIGLLQAESGNVVQAKPERSFQMTV